MQAWLSNWIQNLLHMAGGPGHLRFIIQPIVALLLGVRDGRLDARAHTPPFLWALVFEGDHRRATLRSAAHSLWKPFVVASVMDAIVQVLTLHTVYVTQALLTGTLLVGLPYALVRALTNRVESRRFETRAHGGALEDSAQ